MWSCGPLRKIRRTGQDQASRKIASRIIDHIQGGDIILLHDGGGNRKQTVEALKQVIPELKDRGYEFVKVSELLHHDKAYVPVHLQ